MWGYKCKLPWKLSQKTITMLATYNIIGTVHFPTRITNGSVSAIDNKCIDKTRNYSVSPFINGIIRPWCPSDNPEKYFFTEMSSLWNAILKAVLIESL